MWLGFISKRSGPSPHCYSGVESKAIPLVPPSLVSVEEIWQEKIQKKTNKTNWKTQTNKQKTTNTQANTKQDNPKVRSKGTEFIYYSTWWSSGSRWDREEEERAMKEKKTEGKCWGRMCAAKMNKMKEEGEAGSLERNWGDRCHGNQTWQQK